MDRKTRVMIAVIGNGEGDGRHKAASRALRDEGCEVIFIGADQNPAMTASSALQEDVDAVVLWIADDARPPDIEALRSALDATELGDVPLLIAGDVSGVRSGETGSRIAADLGELVASVASARDGRSHTAGFGV